MAWLQENGLSTLLLLAFLAFMFRGPIMARVTGVEQLSVHALSALMASATPPLLLDVRRQAEFDMGHISGAVLLPVSDLRQRMEEVRERSKSGAIAVVCLSGNRSVNAAVLLKRAGFEKVFNVVGGMAHWKGQGYPIHLSTKTVRDLSN